MTTSCCSMVISIRLLIQFGPVPRVVSVSIKVLRNR
jgi:hypothetical protein